MQKACKTIAERAPRHGRIPPFPAVEWNCWQVPRICRDQGRGGNLNGVGNGSYGAIFKQTFTNKKTGRAEKSFVLKVL